jgi:tetratricopeptide (TPR) repeat protein
MRMPRPTSWSLFLVSFIGVVPIAAVSAQEPAAPQQSAAVTPSAPANPFALGLDAAIPWIDDPQVFLDRDNRRPAGGANVDRAAMLTTALDRARAEGKLVLWSIPRILEKGLAGRQMYRAPILDGYMRHVVFSDADVASIVTTRFVPLRMVCDEAMAERFSIRPLDVVEPAVVFLDADGKVVHVVERIRTFSAHWFAELLRRVLATRDDGVEVDDPARAIAEGRYEQALAALAARKEPTDQDRLQHASVLRRLRRVDEALAKLDEITLPAPARRGPTPPATRELACDVAFERGLTLLQAGREREALPHLDRAMRLGGARTPDAGYLLAAATLQIGQETEALRLFQLVASRHPGTPAGRKASANLLLGPDERPVGATFTGFECIRFLPEAAYVGLPRDTAWAGPEADARTLAVGAVRYLLSLQREHGGFTDSRYAYWPSPEITPNTWVAISALAATALLTHRDVDPKAVDAALAKAEVYLFDPNRLRRGRNEDVYADAYRILYLVRKHALADADARPAIVSQIDALFGEAKLRQSESGFFAHEYDNAFCTGVFLWSAQLARETGAKVPEDMIDRGLTALSSARFANGAYAYGGKAQPNREGSLKDASARMPLCEGTLAAFGRSDEAKLAFAFETFWKFLDRIEKVRRNDFHSDGELAGFFFFHALFHTSEAARLLPDAMRADAERRLLTLLQRVPEMDGSFVDSHEIGRSYGTAMALLTLKNVAERQR